MLIGPWLTVCKSCVQPLCKPSALASFVHLSFGVSLPLHFCSKVSAGRSDLHVGVCRYGIRGLLVDPYNELDHQRPSHMSETEYVSQMLTKIKRFAQHHDVHVWFVAHPRQMRDWKGQPPTMYDISGSAHFINKADNGLVIHRNRDPEAGPLNEVGLFLQSSMRSSYYTGYKVITCATWLACSKSVPEL